MNRYLLIIILISASALNILSQKMNDAEINAYLGSNKYYPKVRDINKRQIADELLLRVRYNYSYVIDTAKMKTYTEPMILDIGRKLNHYYSYNAFLRDSLQMVENKKGPTRSGHAYGYADVTNSVIPKDQTATYVDIYTHHSVAKREVFFRLERTELIYDEKSEPLTWSVSGKTEQVLGYNCMLAEGDYGGRTWRVWFSTDIPYPYGMWKLGGLPGIILKAEDSQGLFKWEAIGLEKGNNRNIYRHSEMSKPVKKNDVEKLWQRMWCASHTLRFLNDPNPVMNIDFDGVHMELKVDMSLAKRYYPRLELE